jgi:hypothetical protein
VQDDYYLVAVVDPTNAVSEVVESNNRVTMDQVGCRRQQLLPARRPNAHWR